MAISDFDSTGKESMDAQSNVSAGGNGESNGVASSQSAETEVERGGTGVNRSIFTAYRVPIFGEPNAEQAYYHGHIDGAFAGDEKAFTAYIESRVRVNDLEQKIHRETEQRKRWQDELDLVLEHQARIAQDRVLLSELESQEQIAKEELVTAETKLEELKKRAAETSSKGSILHAVLYSIAGVAFFLGDVVVSYEVVSQALRLGSGEGIGLAERWGFAIAIACLTFVLKPAYERLCEKHYREGAERVFRWVILIAAVLVAGTLMMLGSLRAEYVETVTQATQSTSGGWLDKPAEIVTGDDVNDEGSATPSTLTVVAFMATSLLFAVAGAICLGIGTHDWREWYHVRRPIRRQLRDGFFARLMRRDTVNANTPLPMLLKLRKREVDRLRSERVAVAQRLAADESRLTTWESARDYRDWIAQSDIALFQLNEDLVSARIEALKHSYDSGYKLAERNIPKESRRSGSGRVWRDRPFVQVRRDIRNRLNF